MNQQRRQTHWLINGILGFVIVTSLHLVYGALAKFIVPAAQDSLWHDILIFALVKGVVYGVVLGIILGFVAKETSKVQRKKFFNAACFFVLFVGAVQLFLNFFWKKPNSQDNFWLYFAWRNGAPLTALLLLKLLYYRNSQ